MDKLFVDSDVVYDFLSMRQPFYKAAMHLFVLAEVKQIKISVSSLSFANLDYLLSKSSGRKYSKATLSKFRLITDVWAVGEKMVDMALASAFDDFEDALQYYTALENGAPIFITRNIKDYRLSIIPVMTPEEYLKSL